MVGMQPEDNCCKAHHSCPNVSENELGFWETGLMHRCMSQVAELLSSLLHLKKSYLFKNYFACLPKTTGTMLVFRTAQIKSDMKC